MRWMEMIRLRTPQGQEKKSSKLLVDSAHAAINEPGLKEARVYTNASFYSDLALNLLWDTDIIHHQGSRVGLSISQALASYGLVEHSIWSEKEEWKNL
ncbi:MAG: hypothetical protein H6Q54_1975 [Deltaproteobacteria bacterium]|nr:hypothetical protein [Deltaproteobacteria bacterium]